MNLKNIFILMILGMLASNFASASCSPLLDHSVRQFAEDTEVNLCETYQGKVLRVVNTASKCGYAGQFETLEATLAELN